MVYESDAFYRACDELGSWSGRTSCSRTWTIPDDEAFAASVHDRGTQQLHRLRAPSLRRGLVRQQRGRAAGGDARHAARAVAHRLFAELLPASARAGIRPCRTCRRRPSGGALPFHADTGVTHYYGVGAYLRPLADARRATCGSRPSASASRTCPRADVVALAMEGDAPAMHDPRWKGRVPRDTGAGWDFEDVRDHYCASCSASTRCACAARHAALPRAEPRRDRRGDVAGVSAEWRGAHSLSRRRWCGSCKTWPGAGWGVLDSRGLPKACYYYLRRAWQPGGRAHRRRAGRPPPSRRQRTAAHSAHARADAAARRSRHGRAGQRAVRNCTAPGRCIGLRRHARRAFTTWRTRTGSDHPRTTSLRRRSRTDGEIVSKAFWGPGPRTPPAGGTRGRAGPSRGESAMIAMK